MRGRSSILPAAAVVLAAGVGLLLIEADRFLASRGTFAAPEAALTLLVVVLLAAIVLVALLAELSARWRPAVSALPAPPTAGTLAWLLATVTLAVVGLASVRLGIVGRQPFTPPLAVMASVALLVVSLIVFARHAHALADAANPYAVVATLGALSRAATERRYPPVCPPELPEPPELQLGRVVPAPWSGYVVSVDVPRLVRAAERGNAIVKAPAVGSFITRGEPLLEIFALDGGRLPARISRAVEIVDIRDTRTDAAFDLGLLSDVAIGGLIAEPGVAEAALDRIGEILGCLGPRPFPSGRYADRRGVLRVLQPVAGWPRLAEIALADIALRGAADPRVRERLGALVDELSRCLPPERAAILEQYAPAPRVRRPPAERHVPVVDLDAPSH